MKYLITALVAVTAFFLPSVAAMALFYVLGVPFNPDTAAAGALTIFSGGAALISALIVSMELDK